MDEMDRMFRRLVHNVRAGFPDLLTRPFEVSSLYQTLIPYRLNRTELGIDSSEEYDNTVKLESYRTIPTLSDYIIVSHRERRITVHSREASGEWTSKVGIAGGRVAVGGVGAELAVDEVYRASSIH